MNHGYCHEVPVVLRVDPLVDYFLANGKPTVDALLTARCRVGRNNGPELLWRLYESGLLTRWSATRHVAAAWSGCEFPEDALWDYDPDAWHYLFGLAGYTVDGRRAERPTEPVKLYRGASWERREGMSWTDDVTVARWFANRSTRIHPESPGRLWTTTVDPGCLLARNVNERPGEPEYICFVDARAITELPLDPPAE